MAPTSVGSLLQSHESYLAFLQIVREVFPDEEGEILAACQPGASRENARVWAFLQKVEERFFPVYEVEEYEQVVCGIPFVREGWSYDSFHDLDLPPGQLLLLAVCAHPYGPEFGGRVALLDACEAHVPRSVLLEMPEGGIAPADVRERLANGPYAAAADFADWVWGETGTAFLDLDDETEVYDAEWTA